MQKKLIALAVAGVVSGGAFAQSNVTIYGRLDYGYDTRSGYDGKLPAVQDRSKGEFRDGVRGGSRIGFKGSEDLGNGTKAIFQAEYGIATDGPANTNTAAPNVPASSAFWTNRNVFVGLTGNWGTLVGGRLDGIRYNLMLAAEQLGGGVGNMTSMTVQYDRADNAFAYISPKFNGFTFTYAHSTGTGGPEGGVFAGGVSKNTAGLGAGAVASGNRGDDILNSFMLKYDNGPVVLWADYETTTQKGFSNSDLKTYVLAGTYDFGMVKIGALYDSLKGDPFSNIGGATYTAAAITGGAGYDKRAWALSASIPLGKWTVKGLYGQVENKLAANSDAKKYGLAVDYALSKRTMVYADFGKVSNDSNAAYGIQASPNSNAYYGNKGIDFGIAHNF